MKLSDKLHMLHRVWRYRLREEKESIAFLLSQDLKGKTVLDIGANYGIYSYWMAKNVGSNGRVISFEPQPELGVHLRDMAKTFGFSNVEIVNKGVSSSNGKISMVRGEVGSGGAHIIENEDVNLDGQEKLEIDIIALDDYFNKSPIKDLKFIKCDVENHELEVFKGAREILKRFHPTILFECHHDDAKDGKVFSFLEDLDYKGFFFFNDKKVNVRDFEKYPYKKPSNTHRNYIFTKA